MYLFCFINCLLKLWSYLMLCQWNKSVVKSLSISFLRKKNWENCSIWQFSFEKIQYWYYLRHLRWRWRHWSLESSWLLISLTWEQVFCGNLRILSFQHTLLMDLMLHKMHIVNLTQSISRVLWFMMTTA